MDIFTFALRIYFHGTHENQIDVMVTTHPFGWYQRNPTTNSRSSTCIESDPSNNKWRWTKSCVSIRRVCLYQSRVSARRDRSKQAIMNKKLTGHDKPKGDGEENQDDDVGEEKSSPVKEDDGGDDWAADAADAAGIIDEEDDNDDDRRDSILDIVSEMYQQDSNGKLMEEKQKYFQSTSEEDSSSPSNKSDAAELQAIQSSSLSDSKRLGYDRVPRKTRVTNDDEAQISSVPSSSTTTSATPDPPSLREQIPQNHQIRPPGAYSVPGMGMLQPVSRPDFTDADEEFNTTTRSANPLVSAFLVEESAQQQQENSTSPVLARAEPMSERVFLSSGSENDESSPVSCLQHVRKHRLRYFELGFFLVMVMAVAIYFALPPLPEETGSNADEDVSLSEALRMSDEIILENREIFDDLIVPSLSSKSREAIASSNSTSPQSLAFEWLVSYHDFVKDRELGQHRLFQRYALATIYYATGGGGENGTWFNNDGWLYPNKHECNWYSSWEEQGEGACGNGDIVYNLDLSDNGLAGTIPDEINLLTNLEFLILSINELSGTIPELDDLQYLSIIDLSTNLLSGPLPIPSTTFQEYVPEIVEMYFSENYLTGSLPSEYGQYLLQLKHFHVDTNYINGTIPESYGNLKRLVSFGIEANDIEGMMPLSICDIDVLTELTIDCDFVGCPSDCCTCVQ